jgi:hypothetical protein
MLVGQGVVQTFKSYAIVPLVEVTHYVRSKTSVQGQAITDSAGRPQFESHELKQ